MLFAMLTRLAPTAVQTPHSLEVLERRSMDRVRAECPEAAWLHSYSVLGPHDYLDIFDAPNIETATKIAVLIRSYGHAETEVWPLLEWERFKTLLPKASLKRAREASVVGGAEAAPLVEATEHHARAEFADDGNRADDDVNEHDYGVIGREPAPRELGARIDE